MRVVAIVAIALGGALILIGLDAEPAVYGGVLAAGLLLAALELWRGRRAARKVTVRAEEAEQQADRLASVGAAVASTDSGRKAAAARRSGGRPRGLAGSARSRTRPTGTKPRSSSASRGPAGTSSRGRPPIRTTWRP